LILASLPSTLFGGEVEDLEDTFGSILDALSSKDLDLFLKYWHPEAVLVVRNYFFPIDRAEAGRKVWAGIFRDFFGNTESTVYTPVDVDFRVLGNVGLVWGFSQIFVEPKEGTPRAQSSRLTVTFKRENGKWLIVSWHDSAPPGQQGPQ
jgi:ketosteroid isomerase-like protein